jgi:hypothetical protein
MLDRRITIIVPILEQGVSNEDKITGWEKIDSVPDIWAEKIETRGTTLVQNERVVLTQIVDWKIRFRSDLDISMRIVDANSQCYSIIGFREVEGRERYRIVTTNFLDNEFWT